MPPWSEKGTYCEIDHARLLLSIFFTCSITSSYSGRILVSIVERDNLFCFFTFERGYLVVWQLTFLIIYWSDGRYNNLWPCYSTCSDYVRRYSRHPPPPDWGKYRRVMIHDCQLEIRENRAVVWSDELTEIVIITTFLRSYLPTSIRYNLYFNYMLDLELLVYRRHTTNSEIQTRISPLYDKHRNFKSNFFKITINRRC